MSGYTFGVAVRADSPWKTWEELVASRRRIPASSTYGTPGANTSLHVTMEDIAQHGIRWTHVPFKGNADNMQALLGGHIDALPTRPDGAPRRCGKDAAARDLGCSTHQALGERADVEGVGYDVVSTSPYGIAAPKGMDPKVAKVLHDAFRKGMEDPSTCRRWKSTTRSPPISTPRTTRGMLPSRSRRQKLVEELGLKTN